MILTGERTDRRDPEFYDKTESSIYEDIVGRSQQFSSPIFTFTQYNNTAADMTTTINSNTVITHAHIIVVGVIELWIGTVKFDLTGAGAGTIHDIPLPNWNISEGTEIKSVCGVGDFCATNLVGYPT